MNRSEASDYIKELQGRESGTWKDAETELNATRGIDTFTEPFEDDDEKTNWLAALGIVGGSGVSMDVYSKG